MKSTKAQSLNAYRLFNGPVREACGITEMPQVVDVAEELVLELRVVDDWDGAVLIQGTGVAVQPRTEVCQVRRDLLNHHTSANMQG